MINQVYFEFLCSPNKGFYVGRYSSDLLRLNLIKKNSKSDCSGFLSNLEFTKETLLSDVLSVAQSICELNLTLSAERWIRGFNVKNKDFQIFKFFAYLLLKQFKYKEFLIHASSNLTFLNRDKKLFSIYNKIFLDFNFNSLHEKIEDCHHATNETISKSEIVRQEVRDSLQDEERLFRKCHNLLINRNYDKLIKYVSVYLEEFEGNENIDFLEGILFNKDYVVRDRYWLDLQRRALKVLDKSHYSIFYFSEHCTYWHLYEEAYEVLKCSVQDLTNIKLHNSKILKLILYSYIQKSLILTAKVDINLIKKLPINFLMDLLSVPIRSTDKEVPNQLSRPLKVALVLSGQIRGYSLLKKVVPSNLEPNPVIVSTWDKVAKSKSRLDNLNKIFPLQLIQLLPQEYRNIERFKEKFPLTFKKILLDSSKANNEIDLHKLRECLPNAIIDVENESIIEQLGPQFICNGNYNQAKMFYKIHRSVDIATNLGVDVIVRSRPDLYIEISEEILLMAIDSCVEDVNLIYIPYISPNLGFGDQFAIGSTEAMKVYASAWEKIKDQGFKDFANDIDTSRGAETLLALHLIRMGLNVKILPIKRRLLLADVEFSFYCLTDSSEITHDYDSLDIKDKQIFEKFYLETKKLLMTN